MMSLKKTLGLLAFTLLFIGISNAQTYREFVALHDLYQKTKGEQWNSSWDLDTPIETWEGVTVENGHVIGLDLSNNNLNGRIPMTLVNLRHLKKLNLSGNQLEGKLPGGMGRFEQMVFLNVSKNRLGGGVPKGIARMFKLKSLQLADNSFDNYSGLEKMQKQQLIAFDMSESFAHLDLMDDSAIGKLTTTKFEDIKD